MKLHHLNFIFCQTVIIVYYHFVLSATPLSFLTPLEDQVVEEIPGETTFECEVSKPNLKPSWKFAGKVQNQDYYNLNTA